VGLPFRVLEVRAAARTWSWSVRLGPVTVDLEHGVQPDGAAGSRTWLRMRGPLLALVAYAPIAQIALHRLVR
jgi:hypothetical protein